MSDLLGKTKTYRLLGWRILYVVLLFGCGGIGDYMLARLTPTAIQILSKNANGFVLMVEGSQIDWGMVI
jgi:hypothetical protein